MRKSTLLKKKKKKKLLWEGQKTIRGKREFPYFAAIFSEYFFFRVIKTEDNLVKQTKEFQKQYLLR